MKNRLPILLLSAFLGLILTACTVQIGFPTVNESAATTGSAPAGTPSPNDPAQTNGGQDPADPNDPPPTTTTAKPVTESTHPYKDETVEVKYPAVVQNVGKTFTGKPPLADITYTVVDPLNKLGISTESFSHSFGVAKNGQPHSITVDNQKRFDSYKYSTLTWDNKTEGKVLYLTFDCGYEYENLTADILDTLKEKKVTATFFCTLPYLKDVPETVVRMINEGHIVGNHSVNHPTDSSALSREELASELLGVHNYLRMNFGYESRYFRFPSGRYSPNSLELVQSIGYRSVFWSIAHADYDTENQPGVDVSFNTVTSRLHPGAVILLHACSTDNAAMLGDFIDYARAQGYEFRSLDQYEYWDN